ncbi:MAG TPA: hypothetical protein VM618_13575, partial [Acidimicrobiia bacterium]|nr:hypothetical protein [Acidimicrobiia bacterium]
MHDGTSGAPLSESVLALVGRWYAASFEAAEHALHRWLEPAVVTFAAAVEAHRNGERGDRTSLTLAARSFGAARASGGFTASDTLLDAAALLDLVPDVVPGDREAVERAVTDGWCGVNPKVGEVFASRAGLALRMRSLYHWAGPGNVGRG